MLRSKLSILLLILIFAGIFGPWFLTELRVANDFPLVSKPSLDSMMDIPFVWSEGGAEGLGEYTAFFLWAYPLTFFSGFLSQIGFNFLFIERIILITILLLGTIGIWKLAESIKLSIFGKFISTLFYLINTYIILLIDGGQLSVGLAYAFLPLSFFAVEKSIGGRLFKKITAGLSISILGFFDFRFIYILALLCLIRFFYQFIFISGKDRLLWITNWIKLGVISSLILIGLNAYWLFPFANAPISQTTFSFFTQSLFQSFGNIAHSILLLSPHWFKNIFGQISALRGEFILIPILVLLAPILRTRDRNVGFWIIVAVLSIFLSKGSAEPFADVYQWLFKNVPFFSLFRDSSKFLTLVALSFAILLGVTTDEVMRGVGKYRKIKLAIFFALLFFLITLISPVFLFQMTGTFTEQPLKGEFRGLSTILEKDQNFSRIFWIPARSPLGYSAPLHPTEEAARLSQKRPFNSGTKGSYETFNFLREAPFMSEIFDVAGVGYIVYPPLDPRRDDMHPDNIKYYQTFSNQLSNLNWLTWVNESPINLWRVDSHQDKFFITDNLWWVIGSDDIYNEATKSADLKLSKNALIFPEEFTGLGKRLDEVTDAKIVLNKKTLTDLAASFIDSSRLIFPSKQLDFDPDQSGWWKREASDLIRWRDFLQTKYGIDNLDFDLGGGWAVGEGNLEFRINPSTSLGTGNSELKKDKILLARVLESTKSGQLSFYQDDQLIGDINTKKGANNIRWFEVGNLAMGDGEFTIKSIGDINVINALAVLSLYEWNAYKDKAKQLEGRIVNFEEKSAQNNNNPTVTYRQINPTRYIVKVSNLTKPSLLVFSQSYDSFWKMNGQNSLPIYSLLNGFKVEKDGEYLVEFEVQKYVYPGLAISGITALIILMLLIKLRFR
ncbi:hypothetical protein A3B45_00245 [Candidatus Daviesbacteria bacterium RIFCSPLOWO2_01_FULL_39_12]|uniref:Membrane protein 6-pyruvoyl-tetrahydropterin synthase-related domain-containing protein n=1 Tax=Candidatus Daviesbacteria bacterium RIFCSPLOWO2_01_FULL_39_12 TaxID=1797785 RepID=A0A1F5KP59_9BACT|nr:MAG: hypothetical protein A3B45_00245 [Candidatus Daviesbacteria bacterium RIFCSPLOWO2_01_FULL_39_12]